MPAVFHKAEVIGEQSIASFMGKQVLPLSRKCFACLLLQLFFKRLLTFFWEHIVQQEFLSGFSVESSDMDNCIPVRSAGVCPIVTPVARVLGIDEYDFVF